MSRKTLDVTTELLRKDGTISKSYTMISEFIDNSISSCLESKNEKDLENLLIEITIDYSDQNNIKIYIIDNANGMSEDAMDHSMKIANKDRTYKTSQLNKFGVGMKVAAFWSGNSIEIFSKRKAESVGHTVKMDLDELDKNNNGIVAYEINEWDGTIKFKTPNFEILNEESGTIVCLENVQQSRYDLLEMKSYKRFLQILCFKYNRYITKGVKIIVNKIDQKNESKAIGLSSLKPAVENVKTWAKQIAEQSNKIKNEVFVTKWVDSVVSQINDSSVAKSIKDDIINKIKNQEDLMWDCNIDLNQNISLPIKIGILKNTSKVNSDDLVQHYREFAGFTVYQADRAIMCGPNTFDEALDSKNYLANLKVSYGGSGTDYRITGEFDIDNLLELGIVKISDQKYNFEWTLKSAEMLFLKFLEVWKSNYLQIIQILTMMQNKYANEENWTSNKRTKDGVMNNAKSTSYLGPDDSYKDIVEEDKFRYIYKNPKTGVEGKICIHHISKAKTNIDFYKLVEKKGNDYFIQINPQHSIWYPLVFAINTAKTNFLTSLHNLIFLLTCIEELNPGSGDILDMMANIMFEEDN
jgi:hypothetical protein